VNPDPTQAPRHSLELTPVQAFAFLWRGRWWIAAATVIAVTLGVWFAERRGTIWRARSVLYVERTNPVLAGAAALLGGLQPRNYANAQAELLRSTPILDTALENPGIAGSPVFEGAGNEVVWLKRHLHVSVGELDDLITVSLDSPARALACDVVNAIVDAYRDFHKENKQKTSSGILTLLEDEQKRREAELSAEQQAQLAFLRENPGVGFSKETASVAEARLRELNSALAKAELEAMDAEAALRLARKLAEAPDLLRRNPAVPARALLAPVPEDAEAVRELAELQTRRRQFQAAATPDHPAVRELDRAIQALEARTAASNQRAAAAYLSVLEQTSEDARKRVEDVASKIAEQEKRIAAIDSKQAEHQAIEKRIERASRLADELFQRVSELTVSEKLDNPATADLSVQVYERATVGGATVASSKTAFVAIVTFLGLVLGIGLAWLRSLVDQRILSADDAAALFPLLAAVPRVSVDRTGAVATWKHSPAWAEAMRSLRTAVYFGPRSARTRNLLITAAGDREGKSLTTAGLGIAMAQAGQRVLIVDADMRDSSQGQLFGIQVERGLVETLRVGAPAELAIVETGVRRLHLLPAGPQPGNPAELLNSPRLGRLLQDLGVHYDRILIDSPPMLEVADSRIIAAVADETLLVMRAGRTTRRMAHAASGAILAVGGRLAGAVLNCARTGVEGAYLRPSEDIFERDAEPGAVVQSTAPRDAEVS
jgi:capsular exopolysaccharide synthesis family protein